MSLQSDFFYFLFKALRAKKIVEKDALAKINGETVADRFACPRPPSKYHHYFDISEDTILSSPVYTLKPKTARSGRVILYHHGGAFINKAAKNHWSFVSKLSRELGCDIVFPDYPLCPAHTHKEMHALAVECYRRLLMQYKPGDIILMGDSAGAVISLALAQQLPDLDLPQPAHIILLSPSADATFTNPEVVAVDKKDPFLSLNGVRAAAKAYAGELPLDHPAVSCIYGRRDGLGKLTIFTSTYDVLWPDVKRFKVLMDADGVEVNYYEYPKMLHAWMLFPLPEAKQVLNQITQILKAA